MKLAFSLSGDLTALACVRRRDSNVHIHLNSGGLCHAQGQEEKNRVKPKETRGRLKFVETRHRSILRERPE